MFYEKEKVKKDGLARPFELPMTKDQLMLYNKIKEICEGDYVIAMTYPQIFEVFDKLKLKYQLSMLERLKLIKMKIKEEE